MKGKFEKIGLSAQKSSLVDAPIIKEFPLSLECKVHRIINDENDFAVIGRIVDIKADDSILDEKGKIDIVKLDPIMFDPSKSGYYKIGEKVGKAFHDGAPLMKE